MKTVDVPPFTVNSLSVLVLRAVLVLSVSTSVSNNNVVDRPIVSIVSVMTVCKVSTINVPGPERVAVKPIGLVLVVVFVTMTTSHSS